MNERLPENAWQGKVVGFRQIWRGFSHQDTRTRRIRLSLGMNSLRFREICRAFSYQDSRTRLIFAPPPKSLFIKKSLIAFSSSHPLKKRFQPMNIYKFMNLFKHWKREDKFDGEQHHSMLCCSPVKLIHILASHTVWRLESVTFTGGVARSHSCTLAWDKLKL